MENATKALLIAAAILVAIIIISITLVVVRQGQEAISKADMTEAEMEQFNAKFKSYEGTNVTTANVNALLSAVVTHNQNEVEKGTNNTVTVDGSVTLDASASSATKLSGSSRYTVRCNYTKGLVTSITVTAKQ